MGSHTRPILGISPFQRPDARLVLALCKAGAVGILDLGRDSLHAREELALADRHGSSGFGVRVPFPGVIEPGELPAKVELVVLPAGTDPRPFQQRPGQPRRVLVQVTSLEEAQAAVSAGADGLIAVGAESGGRTGEESSFVLLQRLLAALDLPIWVQGGVGLHTAAACVAAGAAGLVLDSQLALVQECSLPGPVRDAVAAMDGSETIRLAGYRVFTRPDLPLIKELASARPEEVAARLGWRDLKQELLPVGQDAAFASRLADRFGTAGGVVQALRRSIDAHLESARKSRPLAAGSPLAEDHGTRFPIVQGPMTRVSDRSAFADAVEGGGGLPFLALALMKGEDVRKLVTETAERMGDRPWGVGILGFVPPEIRNVQLKVLEEVRPPFAIVAGGRPAQARSLEAHGTTTYIHVPSIGLLDLFLKEGARRFIFEGRECGGHVGPLTSFVLWELQIEHLLAYDKIDEISVLFAGGIHDGVSGGMVAAMAAPLVEAGAKVGVLMGTAYLFTEEAVNSGAILAPYQEMAVQCENTVLLETAPGHSTRCVDTGYVKAFVSEKERLEAEGLETREVWATLEQMNLGRLRLASKGLRRDGGVLQEVGEKEQLREGMYMIGQVAGLRDSVTTVEELHHEVSEGSVRVVEAAAPERSASSSARPLDIAVVGMACVFPDAPDLEAFWSNILAGKDSVREVPPERWSTELYFDPEGKPGDTTPCKWGAFLGDVIFDPARYGIPPRSIVSIEPVQLLSLEIARRALADAGYDRREFNRERTSVIFGAEGGNDLSTAYGFRAQWRQFVGELPRELDERLPLPTEDTFAGVLANVIAGRIANRLDLGGMNYTVDAACASAMAALEAGVQTLAAGSSDMVLVGGADLHNSAGDYLMFSSVHALSRSGKSKAFDKNADGICLGEGVGVVVLKRLADAERDGDRIYAVLKGMAGSSDGRSLGLTAPRKEGQVRAMQRAYESCGISPAEVELMEGHGTGTVVGDRTELQSMETVFGAAGAEPGTCALGSVKSQIGHTKCAAGMASLLKVALAIHHRVIPPTLHVDQPNGYHREDKSPFVFRNRSRVWSNSRRIGALSSFGFGGTNFHAVVASHDEPFEERRGLRIWPVELFLFRGRSRDEARERIRKLESTLNVEDPWSLADLARAACAGGEGPVHAAVIARGPEELATRLAAAGEFQAGAGVFVREEDAADPGKVAFLFPGQGSQRVGMLSDLFLTFPFLEELAAAGSHLLDRIFPPQAFSDEARKAQEDALTDTRTAQPALGLCDTAMARVLRWLGLEGDMLGGHSYGELAALCHAGALEFADLLDLSESRAEAIIAAVGQDPGAMAAIGAGPFDIQEHMEGLDDVVLANRNAPKQTVISGPTAMVEEAVKRLKKAGLAARRIPVACAFHSGVVAGAKDSFEEVLAWYSIREPQRPVWSNVTAEPYPAGDAKAVSELLARQLSTPVDFQGEIESMYAAGARVFVEVGPGRVLTGLVGQILEGKPHFAVAPGAPAKSQPRGGMPGLEGLLEALAGLAVRGVEFKAEGLFDFRGVEGFDLDAPPARELPSMAWRINGHRAEPVHGPVPPGGLVATTTPPVKLVAENQVLVAADSREQAVVDYLRNLGEMAEAQRQVILSFLGTEPAAAAATVVPRMPSAAERAAAPVARAEIRPPAAAAAATDQEVSAVAEVKPGGPVDIGETLIQIVSERTGYPVEMLDLDLDLEADLSIDSIKRIEILGALNEVTGMANAAAAASAEGQEEVVEELAGIRTLRGIIEWIEEKMATAGVEAPDAGGTVSAETVPAGPTEAVEAAGGNGDLADSGKVGRYVFEVKAIPAAMANGKSVKGTRFVITDDRLGVATALSELLEDAGAEVRIIQLDEDPGEVDGLVHLASLAPQAGPTEVKALFRLAKHLAESSGSWILAATGMGGNFGRKPNGLGRAGQGGVAGLLKSVAKEFPDIHVRAVDLDPSEDAGGLASHLFEELHADDDRVEVGYILGDRRALSAVPAVFEESESNGDHLLDSDSVVLITGGARGITARVAVALAQRYRCRLELVGRTPPPTEEEHPEVEAAADLPHLKRALIALNPEARPAEIEAESRAVMARREILETLKAIREAGSEVSYHALDVRDAEKFGAFLDRLYENRGRIDGVIHGAGVVEDKFLRHKTADSFARVFDTKVVGALTLAEKIRDDAKFVVFFSSVSGAFGNRGQVDYAAANDLLDKLAHHLNDRLAGRVLSVNWGPWDAGMVSPELKREYERHGIGLIPLAGGAQSLLEELSRGSKEQAQVVLANADPSRLV